MAKSKSHKSDKRSERRPEPEQPFFRPFAQIKTAPAPQPEQRAPAPVPKPRKVRSPEPQPDPDEALTFERLMAGVTPLEEGTKAVRVPVTEPAETRARRIPARPSNPQIDPDDAARQRLRALVEEGSRFEVLDDGRQIEGRRRGVDGRLVRRMKAGELPIDATLDLHGLGAGPAREAVEAFVRDRRAKGDRVVLIIHGRGKNSPRGMPVLRGEVAAWLSDGKSAAQVSAFATAPAEHGGEGALCVLLAGSADTPNRI